MLQIEEAVQSGCHIFLAMHVPKFAFGKHCLTAAVFHEVNEDRVR